MDASYRRVLLGTAFIFILFSVIDFRDILWIITACLIFHLLYLKLCTRRIAEPQRPIIMRLGQIHHLGKSGMVFLMPFADEIGQCVNMAPRPLNFTVYQVTASDGSAIYLNLELLWSLRPDIDSIDALIKQTLLKDDTQLERLVERSVTVIARELMQQYSPDEINRVAVREHCTTTLRDDANAQLAAHGITIETVFWRGSVQSPELTKERLSIKLAQERLNAMLHDVQLIQEKMPDMPAEQFLAFQAWLELLKRGIPAPMNAPGIPNLAAMPFPRQPPQPPPNPAQAASN